MQVSTLFDVPGRHEWFAKLRDDPDFAAARQLCKRLAQAFEPYADAQFVSKCGTNEFPARFWEMYCGGFFMHERLGLRTKADLRSLRGIDPSECPDFCLSVAPDIWIEATSVNQGSNSELADAPNGAVRDVPDQPMMTRVLGGLRSKAQQIANYKHNGACRDDEPVVIALNAGQIQHIPDFDPPRVVRALYGIGMPIVDVDRATSRLTNYRYQVRPLIRKAEVPISSDVFLRVDPVDGVDYTSISAVLYSEVTPFNAFPVSISWPEMRLENALPLGADFVVVHNRNPRCPLRRGALRAPREYWIDATGAVRCEVRSA